MKAWGYAGGWTRQTIQVIQGGQTNTIANAWIWRGEVSLAEEWISQEAPRQLMVYAAGNDRLFGPGNATTYCYKSGPGLYDDTGVTNPPAGSRDWRNGDGDTGGYDTVRAPGTARRCSPSATGCRCGSTNSRAKR